MGNQPALKNRVVILNGFTDAEVMSIMRVVKSIYRDSPPEQAIASISAARQLPEVALISAGDLIFAKTTSKSIQMRLADLIVDMSEDHEYLRKNPPTAKDPGPSTTESS